MATRSFYVPICPNHQQLCPKESLPWRIRSELVAYLQHMKECRLSGIVEPQEEELSTLVHKTERCKNIPDYSQRPS